MPSIQKPSGHTSSQARTSGFRLLATVALVLALLWLNGCAGPKPARIVSGPSTPTEKSVEQFVNDLRQREGLPALTHSPRLVGLARGHSANMAEGRADFGHANFQSRGRAAQSAHRGNRSAENVAQTNVSAEAVSSQVVQQWLQSDEHRVNMFGEHRWMGVGIAQGTDGRFFATLLFACC